MAHTSVDEHAAHIRSLVVVPERTEELALGDALGRMTATEVVSPVDLPLFRNSQMDGFAVRAADLSTGDTSLPIVGEVAARPGEPEALAPGTTVRIMTGAVVPDGADAVVPVEDTTATGDTVTIRRPRAAGEYVRDRGSDVRAGDLLLPAATRLAARHLAVLAAAGLPTVVVRERIRVVVVTTGAELVLPAAGLEPQPGQVYDANSVALQAAVRSSGGEVARVIHNDNDDVGRLRAALLDAADHADLIVTSGGISMGEHEVVRDLLEPLGGRVGHVAMQPGGPQATGSFHGVPVVSFPGNPVSTQISFEVFLAPLLREAAGLPAARRATRTLAADLRSMPGKRQFLRGRTVEGGRVEQVAGPGSHLVASLAASDVLIIVPEGTTELKAGDTVETIEL
jgi:molybdopterin molybdotransferase